jgi:hypothetical protein
VLLVPVRDLHGRLHGGSTGAIVRAGQGRRMISGFTPPRFFARGVHPDHDDTTEHGAARRCRLPAGPSLAALASGRSDCR